MNPPYGREIEKWVRKLVAEYDAGHVTEGIALLPARTDTVWFQLLRSRPVCLVRGRLKFSDCPTAAPFPSALVYFGTRAEEFRRAFADIGDTWERSQQALDHPSQPPAGTRSSGGDPPKSGTDYEPVSTDDGVGNSLDEFALELFPGSRFLEEGP